MESAKVAFNAGETEIPVAPPAEYRAYVNWWASLPWLRLNGIIIAINAGTIPWMSILPQARDDLASAKPTSWRDMRSFLEEPMAWPAGNRVVVMIF